MRRIALMRRKRKVLELWLANWIPSTSHYITFPPTGL